MNNEETNQAASASPVEQVVPKAIKQAPVVSTQEWIITILITTIPIINLIMLLIWAFSKEENPNKANWAKANLIWMLVGIILLMLFFGSIMTLLKS